MMFLYSTHMTLNLESTEQNLSAHEQEQSPSVSLGFTGYFSLTVLQ